MPDRHRVAPRPDWRERARQIGFSFAEIAGEPYWDEDFNCMDLFVLLPLDQLEDRYSKHYMRDYIAKDGMYAASQPGTGAAIARDGVYATSVPGATCGAGD